MVGAECLTAGVGRGGVLDFLVARPPVGPIMGQLQDRMAEDLRLRNFSPATCRNYLLYARRFARFYGRSPANLWEGEVRANVQTRARPLTRG